MNVLSYLIRGAAIIAWMYGLTLVSLRMPRRFRRNTFTYLDYLYERRLEFKPLRTMVGFGVLLVFLQCSPSGSCACNPGRRAGSGRR